MKIFLAAMMMASATLCPAEDLEIVRSVYGFDTERPASRVGRTMMVWVEGFPDPPVISYVHSDVKEYGWRSMRLVHDYPFIFAIYEDGTALFSTNPVVGGPPYRMASFSEEAFSEIMANIEQIRTTPNIHQNYYFHAHDYLHAIKVLLPEGAYKTMSSHLLVEAHSDLIATHRGFAKSESTQCFSDIAHLEPEHFRKYRDTWHQLVSIQKTLLEMESVETGDLSTDRVFVEGCSGEYLLEDFEESRARGASIEQSGDTLTDQEIQAIYPPDFNISPFSHCDETTTPTQSLSQK